MLNSFNIYKMDKQSKEFMWRRRWVMIWSLALFVWLQKKRKEMASIEIAIAKQIESYRIALYWLKQLLFVSIKISFMTRKQWQKKMELHVAIQTFPPVPFLKPLKGIIRYFRLTLNGVWTSQQSNSIQSIQQKNVSMSREREEEQKNWHRLFFLGFHCN